MRKTWTRVVSHVQHLSSIVLIYEHNINLLPAALRRSTRWMIGCRLVKMALAEKHCLGVGESKHPRFCPLSDSWHLIYVWKCKNIYNFFWNVGCHGKFSLCWWLSSSLCIFPRICHPPRLLCKHSLLQEGVMYLSWFGDKNRDTKSSVLNWFSNIVSKHIAVMTLFWWEKIGICLLFDLIFSTAERCS